MANELTLSLSLRFSKSPTQVVEVAKVLQRDVTGDDYTHKTQTIGTSAEALNIGDITTPGYLVIVNTDGTNYVEIRDGESGADVVKLKAGDWAMFRLTTATPYAIADTGNCVVEYWLVED